VLVEGLDVVVIAEVQIDLHGEQPQLMRLIVYE
jgi:hypothetical protein